MTRTPRLDAQEGLTDNTELRMESLRLRRTEQLSAWDVARRLGVSTSTVLVWWGGDIPEPPARSLPSKPKQKKRPEPRDIEFVTIRHAPHGRATNQRRAHSRYEHQRKVQMAVAGIEEPKRPKVYVDEPGRGTGVIVPRRQHEVLPKQVPWMEEW